MLIYRNNSRRMVKSDKTDVHKQQKEPLYNRWTCRTAWQHHQHTSSPNANGILFYLAISFKYIIIAVSISIPISPKISCASLRSSESKFKIISASWLSVYVMRCSFPCRCDDSILYWHIHALLHFNMYLLIRMVLIIIMTCVTMVIISSQMKLLGNSVAFIMLICLFEYPL